MLEQLFGLTYTQFTGFVLGFVRVATLISVAPVLGSRAIPGRVKLFLALFLGLCVLPVTGNQVKTANQDLLSLVPLAASEILVGLLLGFCARLVFESFQFAGRLVGNQMGLGVGEIIDPENGAQSSPIGNIYSMMATLFFLGLNAHHFLISALCGSFRAVPLGSATLHGNAGSRLLLMFNDIFIFGVKLAVPAVVTLFLIEISMGIIARIVPQMNIFFIGLPLRLGAGLLMLAASLPLFHLLFAGMLGGWQRHLKALIFTF